MASFSPSAQRPAPDSLLVEIAEYALGPSPASEEALATARWVLLDSMGCALLALNYADCRRVLGPVTPGAVLPGKPAATMSFSTRVSVSTG